MSHIMAHRFGKDGLLFGVTRRAALPFTACRVALHGSASFSIYSLGLPLALFLALFFLPFQILYLILQSLVHLINNKRRSEGGMAKE